MENNYINDALLKTIAREQKVEIKQINAVLGLIEQGATVPFIARYRKEITGNLDEEQIRAIYQEWEYGQKLAQRKEDVMRLIEEKGKLTDELKQAIIAATKLAEIEDIYRPFKEKKKTRATDAKKKGLEPLALWLLTFPESVDIEAEASNYVTIEPTEEMVKEGTVVKNVQEALQGAMDIIAETISDEPRYRAWIKEYFNKEATLKSEVKNAEADTRKVFEMYYEYEEPLHAVKLHRVLALNRGENEKILKVSINENAAFVTGFIYTDTIQNRQSPAVAYIEQAIEDAYKRLIKPSIEREIRSELKELAENQAIHIFGENLRNYLLTPPMKDRIVLGVDPAFRTGCKLACVDATGKVLEKTVIYPHQKSKSEEVPTARYENAVNAFLNVIIDNNVEIVAIGNGTASRETEAFVSAALKKLPREVKYVIVSEAGASVYSASELAREEFPDYEVEERSAVSIARRLQDPLAELVKIDPKAIGVGQYQHDVTQAKLSNALDFVVETAVNKVGVNINTASTSLLKYVAGLNAGTAKKIVAYRDENGRFTSREAIKVKGVGPKALEQAIGFLRIPDGEQPLDSTSIHPESYNIAKQILDRLGLSEVDLGTPALAEAIKTVDKASLITELSVGEYTLNDILDAFVAPTRDPREEIDAPVLRSDVINLADLQPGMELQGTVRNVVDFGAFVDCGVHDDGLVHISKISRKFIKHPLEVVNVGQIVKVWVIEVDIQKSRLQLTMLDPSEPVAPPQPKRDNRPRNQNNQRQGSDNQGNNQQRPRREFTGEPKKNWSDTKTQEPRHKDGNRSKPQKAKNNHNKPQKRHDSEYEFSNRPFKDIKF